MNEFIDTINRNLAEIDNFSVGICSSCPTCVDLHNMSQEEFKKAYEENEIFDEGSFSKENCESCGSSLHGNRYSAHGFANEELLHFEICEDCLMFFATGEEPVH